MSRSTVKQGLRPAKPQGEEIPRHEHYPDDYFRIRDFEYVQPLYDLAFLLEIDSLAKAADVPKYRTFSLWRAAFSLDGYGTTIDRWLGGLIPDSGLDYIPSPRIRQYLRKVGRSGTIPELRPYRGERYARCLRLRSVRGLGPSQIALTVAARTLPDEWPTQAINLSLQRDRISDLFRGHHFGSWQTAHIVPPLLRFLRTLEDAWAEPIAWKIIGISDPFEPVTAPFIVTATITPAALPKLAEATLKREKLFRRGAKQNGRSYTIKHQMGWSFSLDASLGNRNGKSILAWIRLLDPLGTDRPTELASDLHLHTAWSDGSASVNSMALAATERGLKHIAVTDHSRSSKLQGGLTPLLWLRQANALTLAAPVCPVLHGIEVDILDDGRLDLPNSLLAAADFVVASVHSSWTDDPRENTRRLVRAIESGLIDVIAHPTSAIIGKPGVPDFVRSPAEVYWVEVFEKCALWRVAVELNCFPSRLDLPLPLLTTAISTGCAISLGSDAHARSHLLNLRFGEAALRRISAPLVLNRLSYTELKNWIKEGRAIRLGLTKTASFFDQPELPLEPEVRRHELLEAWIQPPQTIPAGSKIVGVDLTAGNKATGVATLSEFAVETRSLGSDEEILAYIKAEKPAIVSIDSPLGLPGGESVIDRKAGIVRVAEYDLASIGIPAYPALIDSMAQLTLRGIGLRQSVEKLPAPPTVIESYPGAAQDILCIPRKQKSLDLLREGLRRLGLKGTGLDTRSDDEMDAITSAIVGRYFESRLFEPMGIPREAQLIVPKIRPLVFAANPIICLAGKTGAGKSVVARYLSVFYGFEWLRTRNLIRDLLIEDSKAPRKERIFQKEIDPSRITESHLREFGAIILDIHKQIPLRNKLTKTVKTISTPVVVDSIRDVIDVDRKALFDRPILVWFVECPDTIIHHRLSERQKSGETRIKAPSPVDRTAPKIRREANSIIANDGSLEELRWLIDDTLFQSIILEAPRG